MDDLLQLAFIEFITRDAPHNPDFKSMYFKIIFDILDSSSNTAVYEAAIALTKLSTDPMAIKGVASKLIELAIKEPDNNVKLIVLSRLTNFIRPTPVFLTTSPWKFLLLSTPQILTSVKGS